MFTTFLINTNFPKLGKGLLQPVAGIIHSGHQFTCVRQVGSTHSQHHRSWRKLPTACQVGTLQHIINTFFWVLWWELPGSHSPLLERFCYLGEAFQLLAVTVPWWGSEHCWTRASLWAEGLSSSPAVTATCCCVLIGTAENLALHLRHALISLWINNYWKKELF